MTEFCVRILGAHYDVEFRDKMREADSDYGECIHQHQRIIINSNVGAELQRSALLHEILEALLHRLEIDLKHGTITRIEAGLFQVLADNPWLAGYLSGEDDHDDES